MQMVKGLLVFTLLGLSSLIAAEGAKLYGAKCAECHGADGKDAAIAGKAIIGGGTLTKLNGYKAGTFGGAQKETMQASLTGISDADLQAIAVYVDTLK
jgi:cytochrome c